ncbi:MAG: hypothetical protein ACRD0X_02070 [Thermoanaerobaculia bacterium]
MDILQDSFVHEPMNILVVAAIFFFAHLAFKRFSGSKDAPLLVPAVCWAVYAAWEFAMMNWRPETTPSPEIRFDLLLIWPILLVLSVWFVIQALRS